MRSGGCSRAPSRLSASDIRMESAAARVCASCRTPPPAKSDIEFANTSGPPLSVRPSRLTAPKEGRIEPSPAYSLAGQIRESGGLLQRKTWT
jgi:hypothetical protein